MDRGVSNSAAFAKRAQRWLVTWYLLPFWLDKRDCMVEKNHNYAFQHKTLRFEP